MCKESGIAMSKELYKFIVELWLMAHCRPAAGCAYEISVDKMLSFLDDMNFILDQLGE